MSFFNKKKNEEQKPVSLAERLKDLQFLPVASFGVDESSRIVSWNPKMEELTGIRASEVVGQKSWQGFSADKSTLPIDTALRYEQEEQESAFLVKNNRTRSEQTVEFSATPVKDENGRVVGAIATLTTQTGHGEQNKNEVLHLLPTPIMQIDRDYNVQFLNQSGASLLGMTSEQAVGRKCYELFNTPHCNTPECRCKQAMDRNGTFAGETVVDPRGLNMPISYTGAPVKDDSGNIIGAIEYVTDITQTKKAIDDATLKVDYLNRIPTPVMVVDKDMNVTFMNPAGAGAVGRTPEQCKGEKCFSLFNTGHCNTPDCQVKKAMQSGVVSTSDTIAKLPSGDLPIRYSGAAIIDNTGNVIGGLEYVVDISKEYAVTDNVMELAEAAIAGRLDTRVDESKFDGNYKRIVSGLNSTLDAVIEPITEAAQVLEKLSNYDLTARVRGNYQGDHAKIKNSLNQTGSALQESIMQVREAVNQVNSAAQQISTSSQQVAEGASEQASSLEETTSSMEEMSSMTKQNADNTRQAKTLSMSTQESAEKGTAEMERMLEAMGKIKTAAERTAEIIKDINDIAFQTNLLALNAAVEAARAGDAGRGFAVVAEEVRNLAGRAKDAAQNTERLIKESVSLAESGEQISSDVNANLREMASAVSKVTDIVSEINVASEEQSRGIEQVNKAMVEMDQATQRAAANSEESSSAAEELAGQAQELAAMVGKFHLGDARGRRPSITSATVYDRHPAKQRRAAGANHIQATPAEIMPMDDDPDFAEF
ncbi:MAG: PAS domain-containing protein [Deltaproteobacteria bacterium]|nr:PAS domain-containing protein [Deltaproteobacteria bacterium]MBN2672466.1 PAS domain-containing protein [Deltaproteobacteria bacterium]